ncbi:2Fe-2S iron-sulfur cluster-binding protein [Terasakiella sp. SH-1]|uniref:NADH-quinone oxidoreductase subunit B family protein n=1 Tax=Terasakiella sp. SH-1 TaxID=2560057 RepID=UPI001F0FA497|nr:2Fe-2S iron-sulfur cluster-binding protein [Terasakiella sp. SH-1]
MSDKKCTFTLDGKEITSQPGQTIMEACDDAGIHIPRLCDVEGLRHQGSCRVCTVKVNGCTTSSCTQPAEEGLVVESETEEIINLRRDVVRMLFHEGNHLCPICEASGNCELQATAYDLGITQPTKFPYLQPVRSLDASHPDIALDTNRCIRCGRCIRASQDVDDKGIFGYTGRGIHRNVAVNGDNLADTNASLEDVAFSPEICPVGCIIRKKVGFSTPIGKREFDDPMPEGNGKQKNIKPTAQKKRIATTSLAGCFGCHMSLLDIDERVLDLMKVAEFDRSPLNDIKKFTTRCDIGLIEGGCCNEENVHVLQEFRKNCDILVAVGQCAIMGGLPVMRNAIMHSDDPLKDCFDEAYINSPYIQNDRHRIPDDPALPLILDSVYSTVDVVKVDYQIPGCPPSGDMLWQTLSALIAGEPESLPKELIKYD